MIKTILIAVGAALALGLIIFSISRVWYAESNRARNTSTPTAVVNPSPMLDQIVNSQWLWRGTEMTNGMQIPPDDNNSFTLTLTTDGTAVVTTDCNNGSGTYSTSGANGITFGPMAMTRKFCEGSGETAYMNDLAQIDSYLYQDGKLFLIMEDDAGKMEFIRPVN